MKLLDGMRTSDYNKVMHKETKYPKPTVQLNISSAIMLVKPELKDMES